MLERHPDLRVVVDHGAKPRIRDGVLAPWAAAMADVAAHPQVACKLSGLVTEAPAAAGCETLRPYIDTLLELFGPARLVWGSDWPVVELAGGYDRWHGLAQEALSGLDAAARAAVFGGNAERIYLEGSAERGQCAAVSGPGTRSSTIAATIIAMKNTSVHDGIARPRKYQPASAHSPLPLKTLASTSASGIVSIM